MIFEMNEHEHRNTRITLERVTVTTIRRRSGEPVYCDLCRCEIEVGAGTAIEQHETKLLTTGEEQIVKKEK